MIFPPLWAVIAAFAFGWLLAAAGDDGTRGPHHPHMERIEEHGKGNTIPV